MSLKDQAKWALSAAVARADGRGAGGGGRRACSATACASWRRSTTARCAPRSTQTLGAAGIVGALSGRQASRDEMAYALLYAERLASMLSHVRARRGALPRTRPPHRGMAAWPTASCNARCRCCACTARSSAAATAARWRRSQRETGATRDEEGARPRATAAATAQRRTVLQRPARVPGPQAVAMRFGRILGKRFTRNNLAVPPQAHVAFRACGARPRPSAAAARTSSRSGWATPTRWAARSCCSASCTSSARTRSASSPAPSAIRRTGTWCALRDHAPRPQHRAPAARAQLHGGHVAAAGHVQHRARAAGEPSTSSWPTTTRTRTRSSRTAATAGSSA